MKKTCTVTLYLCNRIAKTGCTSAIRTSSIAFGLHPFCTRKMNVELKFDYYERVGKVGVDHYLMCPVSGLVDFCPHWC